MTRKNIMRAVISNTPGDSWPHIGMDEVFGKFAGLPCAGIGA